MASEWSNVKLGDVAEGLTVGFVGSMAEHYVNNGIPFLRSQDILPYRIDFSDIKYITPEFNNKIRKSALLPGDVVIVRTGKPGTAAVVPENIGELNCSDLVIVRPGKNLDSKFLCYYLNTLASGHVAAHLVGAVQQHFNVGSAKQLELSLPPLPIQHRIASILSAFDDKIELNRQMNRTLEQMARALFKSWFVDFDPVRAKMRGEQPEGMDAETAALFPDELVEVNGREVPRGWEVKGLDELAEFLNGLALQKYPATGENDLPIIKIAQLKKGEAEGAGFASRQIGEKYTVHNGDILFSWSGSLEVTRWAGGEGALNQHLFKVSSKDYPHWFIYGWLLEHLPEFQAIAANKATTMGHIQRKHLNDAKATLPPTADLAMMETVMQPIFESVYANDLEAKQLSKLRDELLPRLLSGEIRVTDLVDHQR